MPRKLAAFLLLALLLLAAGFSATCSSDADCSNGESCSTTYSACYLSDFVTASPSISKLELGKSKTITAAITPPVSGQREMSLKISGQGKYFTRFVGGQPTLTVLVTEGEVKRVPLIFTAGAVGSYSICVDATDAAAPDINNTHPTSRACSSFIVESGRKGVLAVTTPGLGAPELLLLGLLAAAGYSLFRRPNQQRERSGAGLQDGRKK